ncbi:MAG: hypothetical protein FVQ81_05245 [Candidatus Glassbacteria bacterium]|nr:hypothetical protein [Candidatus Glassbacteria bacterium]
MHIPVSGTNYKGYCDPEKSWGLPSLKAFIDTFASLHFKETEGEIPSIGNKAVRDGVKYGEYTGKSHARGYAVDIDFGVDTGNDLVKEGNYDEDAHREQIKRYLECGATFVYIGNENLADEFDNRVQHDDKDEHNDHDHVNAPH